jgi:hypothetical protein
VTRSYATPARRHCMAHTPSGQPERFDPLGLLKPRLKLN